MNREQKRRQAKKNKRKNLNTKESKMELSNLIKLAVIIVIIFGVIYLLSAIFLTEELKINDNNDNTTETVSNAILASQVFNQSEEEYYVYFYDFNNENSTMEQFFISKLYSEAIYRVNTADALNQNYVTDEDSGNKDVTNLSDLKVISPTIIKIEGDKVTSYFEGEDGMTDFMEQ